MSADSDGPVEWCKVVPDPKGESLAGQFPELSFRVEPAHREAYVNLGPTEPIGLDPARLSLAEQALRARAEKNRIEHKQLSLEPEDLGVRITYLASSQTSETSGPDCDFAVPFA